MNNINSILDRDYYNVKGERIGRPDYIIETETLSEFIIPVIVLIIIIIFILVMLYLLLISGFETKSNNTSLNITCPEGQCGTDLFTGFKTCPTNFESIVINPSQSVCNNPFVCDNPITPYALQSDGSTDLNGVCEPNTRCACLRTLQCPSYIQSIFNVSNGNISQPLNNQRIALEQSNSFITSNNMQTTIPPIKYTNPATSFCSVPINLLAISSPGCNFVSTLSIDIDDILYCMGEISNCNNNLSSPCLQGTLALITNNPDNINETTIFLSQFGCVSGDPCPCNTLAVFDTNSGTIVCKSNIRN